MDKSMKNVRPSYGAIWESEIFEELKILEQHLQTGIRLDGTMHWDTATFWMRKN